MNIHFRSRKNSRIVTQNLLNFSQQFPNFSTPIMPIEDQKPHSSTQDIKKIYQIKNNNISKNSNLQFKTFPSIKKRSSQLKKNSFLEQFIQKKQISLAKVGLKYNSLNMALRDMSEVYNQSCFMSTKLKNNEIHLKTQIKLSLSKSKIIYINRQTSNKNPILRGYFDTQQQKVKQLKNINQVRKKFSFLKKQSNNTIM